MTFPPAFAALLAGAPVLASASKSLTVDGSIGAVTGEVDAPNDLSIVADGSIGAVTGEVDALNYPALVVDGAISAVTGEGDVENGRTMVIDGALGAVTGEGDVEVTAPDAHRYWRVGADDDNGGGGLSVSEIGMLIGGVDQTSGGTPFATARWNAATIANAFDNNTGTLANFSSFGGFNGPTEYIGYDFGVARAIEEVTWNNTGVSPANGRSPSDNGTDYTGVYVSGVLTWGTGETKTFSW
jgi:hypothetical protein